eukprot:8804349-Lingulodinium_polyedra.AAC.1
MRRAEGRAAVRRGRNSVCNSNPRDRSGANRPRSLAMRPSSADGGAVLACAVPWYSYGRVRAKNEGPAA